MIDRLKSYLLIQSTAWWGGAFLIFAGLGSLIAEEYAPAAAEHLTFARSLIALVWGLPDTTALYFVATGVVSVGLRAAVRRATGV